MARLIEEVELGDLAKDMITGFDGMVTGITKWLNSCERILLCPQELKDGSPIESQWFDIQQVAVVEKHVFKKLLNERDEHSKKQNGHAPGGPRKDPMNNKMGG